MFYCEQCRKDNQWPETMSKSLGNCEMCGKKRVCNDLPSHRLPITPTPKEAD